jgi:FkbM family methyltransferase
MNNILPNIAWLHMPPKFENVSQCSLFIDIGAHVGHVSAKALELGVKNIIAYEPVIDNFEHLCKLPIKAYRKAVNVTKEPTLIKVIPNTKIGVRTRHPIQVEPIIVESELFSDILSLNPDGIKIDIEGFEYEEGFLDQLLEAKIPHLWLELHNNPLKEHWLEIFIKAYKNNVVVRNEGMTNVECYFTY